MARDSLRIQRQPATNFATTLTAPNAQTATITSDHQNLDHTRGADFLEEAKGSGGQPLASSTRDMLEPKFGHSFANVRIYNHAAADSAAQSVSAAAFTAGQDVFFRNGLYNPQSPRGLQLLAHELTHTIQQRDAKNHGEPLEIGQRDDASEQNARAVARTVGHSDATSHISAGSTDFGIQRTPGVEHEYNEEPKDETQKHEREEERFAERGDALLSYLKVVALVSTPKWAQQPSQPSGHTSAGNLKDYPAWFYELQQLLIKSTQWTEEHEKAQHLLRDYAMYRAKRSGNGQVPENVAQFFDYIGRGTKNSKATEKYAEEHGDTKNSADLGGGQGTPNWCAAASSGAVKKALESKGLKVKGNYEKWANKQVMAYKGQALQPGDILTLVGKATPISGHVATVVEASENSITMVSGNASSHSATVLEQVTVEAAPSDYNYWDNITKKSSKEDGVTNPSRPGVIWIINITRMVSMDLTQLDKNADPNILKKQGLEPIP
jgi:hypothetical protein